MAVRVIPSGSGAGWTVVRHGWLLTLLGLLRRVIDRTGLSRFDSAWWFYHWLLKWTWNTAWRSALVSGVEIAFTPKWTHPATLRVVSSYVQKLYHEPGTTRVIARLLSPNRAFFDVGANIGYYSAFAARHLGDKGRLVHAFEPDPINFQLLADNMALNGASSATIVKAAVCATAGVRPFLPSPRDGSDGCLLDAASTVEGTCQVHCLRLDEYATWLDVKVGLVKIDVECSEIVVVDGMSGLIRDATDLCVIVEYYPAGWHTPGGESAFSRMLFEGGWHAVFGIDEDVLDDGLLLIPVRSTGEAGRLCGRRGKVNLLLVQDLTRLVEVGLCPLSVSL